MELPAAAICISQSPPRRSCPSMEQAGLLVAWTHQACSVGLVENRFRCRMSGQDKLKDIHESVTWSVTCTIPARLDDFLPIERKRESEKFNTSIRPVGPMRTEHCSCLRQANYGCHTVTDGLLVLVPIQRSHGTCRALIQLSKLGSDFIKLWAFKDNGAHHQQTGCCKVSCGEDCVVAEALKTCLAQSAKHGNSTCCSRARNLVMGMGKEAIQLFRVDWFQKMYCQTASLPQAADSSSAAAGQNARLNYPAGEILEERFGPAPFGHRLSQSGSTRRKNRQLTYQPA